MQHDAIIIGGSFAGLSAALYIARARRSVCLLDTDRRATASRPSPMASLRRMVARRGAMLATVRAGGRLSHDCLPGGGSA
jgi:2-polyprenyl-6-methoxyphenol hydroxylase-like FAD-dependent oxidoreductase